METQKITNLLNDTDNENSKFATRKWYVLDNESKGNYSKSIESSLCDYSDAYIIVTGNITVTRTISANLAANTPIPKKEEQPVNAATQAVFKCCTPYNECWQSRFY